MRKGKLRKSWTLFYNNYFIKPFKMTIIFSLICLFVIKFFLFIFQARSQRSFQFLILRFFFSIWVFFHEHSRFTGQQGKGEGIYLTPLYHFHPLHRHLYISQAIAAESSPLHIASSRAQTGNHWFRSASH